jgi:hypothetical protein
MQILKAKYMNRMAISCSTSKQLFCKSMCIDVICKENLIRNTFRNIVVLQKP